MGQVGTFNENVFHSVFGLACMTQDEKALLTTREIKKIDCH